MQDSRELSGVTYFPQGCARNNPELLTFLSPPVKLPGIVNGQFVIRRTQIAAVVRKRISSILLKDFKDLPIRITVHSGSRGMFHEVRHFSTPCWLRQRSLAWRLNGD